MSVAIELHSHSRHGQVKIGIFPDCVTQISRIFSQCHSTGLQGIAVTDHDPVDFFAHTELTNLNYASPNPLLSIKAAEITTAEKRHVLAYNLDRPVPSNQSLSDTLEDIHSQENAIAVAAHPLFLSGVSLFQLLNSKFDAVESFNSAIPKVFNWLVSIVLNSYHLNLPRTNGSDAHVHSEIGRSRAIFPDWVTSADQVVDCIRHGNFLTQNNPPPYLQTVLRVAWSSASHAFDKR